MPVAIVTGAGSGLGREIALQLAVRQYRVFGTAVEKAEIDDLAVSSNGAVTLKICDITREDQLRDLAAFVAAESGGGVNLLVNNAGTLTPGPLEIIPLDAVRREFEVNTFAFVATVNAFLPALRNAMGKILQISTTSVDFPSPFNSLSSASKAAAEAFATAYRAELYQAGIEVIVAVPGNMRTGGPARTRAALERVRAAMTDEQRLHYGVAFGKFADRINAGQHAGTEAATAAAAIVALAAATPSLRRAPIGDDAREILDYVATAAGEAQDIRRLKSIGIEI